MRRALLASLAFALSACSSEPTGPSSAEPARSALAIEDAGTTGAPTALASASSAVTRAVPDFSSLVASLSEPDGPFFSDNVVSNETSYLQIAPVLDKRHVRGGVYLGVGPEQNFSYIAMTRPDLAFIVDIRRGNMLLQLLYKSFFEEATSRAHFLSLLLGRPYDAARAPANDAPLEEVLSAVKSSLPDEAYYRDVHARSLQRIERLVKLDAKDKRDLERLHRSFFKDQLDVRFELKEQNGRKYPTLEELLAAKDPSGEERGFLAEEQAFRFVQRMEKEDRIVPIVGDFAGDRAMPGIAKYLAEEHLTLRTFYVSNVEQYLLSPPTWTKWTKNVEAMPIDADSIFVRCYLDQGKKHPLEASGQRTATVAQSFADFVKNNAKKPYRDFYALTTDGALE